MEGELPGFAEKLDKDLEKFVSELKPRTTQDAWPEDKWEEEMEKHPLFTSKPIEEGDQLPPLIEAMQQLKYDPDVNTPEELAQSYKTEGNEYFKLKKYKWAVISYTEALKARSGDEEENALIYSNRAAAHFHIGNIQKALKDAIEALNKKPTHLKAIQRAAQCSLKLKNFEECISWCEKGLQVQENDKFKESFHALLKDATNSKKLADRDKRKALSTAASETEKWNSVRKAIEKRGINCYMGKNDGVPEWWSNEKTVAGSKVHIDGEGCLIWPVLILYPEYNVTDFIQHFYENSCFDEQLKSMFDSGNEPSWDLERKYKLGDLQVYYIYEQHVIPVHGSEKLLHVLSDKKFRIIDGVPSFFITVKHSKFDCYWRSKKVQGN